MLTNAMLNLFEKGNLTTMKVGLHTPEEQERFLKALKADKSLVILSMRRSIKTSVTEEPADLSKEISEAILASGNKNIIEVAGLKNPSEALKARLEENRNTAYELLEKLEDRRHPDHEDISKADAEEIMERLPVILNRAKLHVLPDEPDPNRAIIPLLSSVVDLAQKHHIDIKIPVNVGTEYGVIIEAGYRNAVTTLTHVDNIAQALGMDIPVRDEDRHALIDIASRGQPEGFLSSELDRRKAGGKAGGHGRGGKPDGE